MHYLIMLSVAFFGFVSSSCDNSPKTFQAEASWNWITNGKETQVMGSVSYSDGSPIAGIEVCTETDSGIMSTVTSQDGTFSIVTGEQRLLSIKSRRSFSSQTNRLRKRARVYD